MRTVLALVLGAALFIFTGCGVSESTITAVVEHEVVRDIVAYGFNTNKRFEGFYFICVNHSLIFVRTYRGVGADINQRIELPSNQVTCHPADYPKSDANT